MTSYITEILKGTEYCEQLYANEFEKLVFQKNMLSELTQEDIEYLNKLVILKTLNH